MTTTTIAQTVAQDATMLAAKAVLIELCETQERKRARHLVLSAILAHRFNNRVSVPTEVAHLSVRDASLEIDELDRQLADLERRIDAQHAALKVADVAAQATILEAEAPTYRRLVAACDEAKAAWDATEATRENFLLDLRRRGVFQAPLIAERERQ